MTTQPKRFIEWSDILALRFECKDCGSELLISSLRDLSKREEQGKLSNCPVCRKPWASVNGSTCELAIAEFLSALNKVRGLIGSQGTFPAGFSMTIEIKGKEQEKDDQK
jgi:transcription elongation factor Elf1